MKSLCRQSNIESFSPRVSRLQDVLATQEDILSALQQYYKGSFENHIWGATAEGNRCYTLKASFASVALMDHFRTKCVLALECFTRGDAQRGGSTINSANADIQELVKAEHPRILPCLFSMLRVFILSGHVECYLMKLENLDVHRDDSEAFIPSILLL